MRIDRARLNLIVLSALPLAIGALLAGLILDSAIVGGVLLNNSRNYSLADILIQAGISTGLGTLVVLSLFYLIEKRGSGTKRAIIAFIVSPILTVSFFILGQSLLLILFDGTTPSLLPSILSLATLGVLLMSFIFILTDSVPPLMKNLFVIIIEP